MILLIQKGENNRILREKSKPVEIITADILGLAKDMIETMVKNNGVGLAAAQIGKNIRMFVANREFSPKQIFINPEICKISKKTETIEEGCLSFPGMYKKIPRAKTIKIRATDENGKEFKLKAKAMLARIIQHEMDHLDGILIVDHE
jgi:peptide deformylase